MGLRRESPRPSGTPRVSAKSTRGSHRSRLIWGGCSSPPERQGGSGEAFLAVTGKVHPPPHPDNPAPHARTPRSETDQDGKGVSRHDRFSLQERSADAPSRVRTAAAPLPLPPPPASAGPSPGSPAAPQRRLVPTGALRPRELGQRGSSLAPRLLGLLGAPRGTDNTPAALHARQPHTPARGLPPPTSCSADRHTGLAAPPTGQAGCCHRALVFAASPAPSSLLSAQPGAEGHKGHAGATEEARAEGPLGQK